jgi:septal ring factor EnvC (AmiA/AmiB activator)
VDPEVEASIKVANGCYGPQNTGGKNCDHLYACSSLLTLWSTYFGLGVVCEVDNLKELSNELVVIKANVADNSAKIDELDTTNQDISNELVDITANVAENVVDIAENSAKIDQLNEHKQNGKATFQ